MWLVGFVKDKEGFREKAYQDAVGVWTVGYGTTRMHGRPVKESDVVSEGLADELLQDDLEGFLKHVIDYGEDHGYDWNNNQIGALTSFCYNLGKGSLSQLTKDGTRSNEVIATKILLYHNAGGKKLPGLVTRRNEEADHFNS